MRRHLVAIIGAAFCVGALTALWATRPWEHPGVADSIDARHGATADAPVASVGTYRESGSSPGVPPPVPEPAPPLPPPPDARAGPGAPRDESVAAPSSPAAGRGVWPDLAGRLLIPVQGVEARELLSTFHRPRGTRQHEAIDIIAPRGTPVLAAANGEIAKLFYSERGGTTVYQFEPSGTYCYYYAHLDRYADGLHEGQQVARGQVIAYVGSTGNADAGTPHLHFAIFRLGPERRWWEGTPVDPYPLLARR